MRPTRNYCSVDGERHGSEAKNKHCETDPAEPNVSLPQWNGIIKSHGVSETDEEQDRAPKKPALPVEDAERNQRKQKRLRYASVKRAKESVRNVTSIELAYRK